MPAWLPAAAAHAPPPLPRTAAPAASLANRQCSVLSQLSHTQSVHRAPPSARQSHPRPCIVGSSHPRQPRASCAGSSCTGRSTRGPAPRRRRSSAPGRTAWSPGKRTSVTCRRRAPSIGSSALAQISSVSTEPSGPYSARCTSNWESPRMERQSRLSTRIPTCSCPELYAGPPGRSPAITHSPTEFFSSSKPAGWAELDTMDETQNGFGRIEPSMIRTGRPGAALPKRLTDASGRCNGRALPTPHSCWRSTPSESLPDHLPFESCFGQKSWCGFGMRWTHPLPSVRHGGAITFIRSCSSILPTLPPRAISCAQNRSLDGKTVCRLCPLALGR